MPVSKKQLAWANATHQPFAAKWNAQYEAQGLEKPKKKVKHRGRRGAS